MIGAERPGLVVREVVPTATWAAFPGLADRVYRMLVIALGPHALVMRLILGALKRQAESLQAGRSDV